MSLGAAAISGFCFVISEKTAATAINRLCLPGQQVGHMSAMTYVQVLEPGGGTTEPRTGGDAPTLIDANVAFCGGMMENISIRSGV